MPLSPAAEEKRRAYMRNRMRRLREDPMFQRNQHLRKYGITQSDYEAMEVAQGSRCAICDEFAKLVVDHDHETGCIRGLLCSKCNSGIGLLGDDAESVRRALAYLERGA